MMSEMEQQQQQQQQQQQMRLDLVRQLLLSSPPGQFDALWNDIQTLWKGTNQPTPPNTFVQGVRDEYQQSRHHETTPMVTSSSKAQQLSPAASPLVELLEKELEQYRHRFFSSKGLTSTFGVTTTAMTSSERQEGRYKNTNNNNNKVIIQTFAERVDSVNLYSGSWVAQWTVEYDPNGNEEEATVSGQVRIHSFCYEEGNLQLVSTRDFPTVRVTSLKSSSNNHDDDKHEEQQQQQQPSGAVVPLLSLLAMAIVEQIQKFESELLEALSQVFDQMGDQLKSIRRVLPITRTRMEWNVRAHRMVHTLSSTSSSSSSSTAMNALPK